MRRYEEAIEAFSAIASSTSKYAKSALISKGECYNALRKFDEALAVFNSILEKEPENEIALQGKQYAVNPPDPLPPPPPPVETPPEGQVKKLLQHGDLNLALEILVPIL
jgi:tetratricopeptide (TPR) repeat protein